MDRNQKNLLLLFLFFSSYFFGTAQISKNYSLSGDYIYGEILKHNKHLENLVKGPLRGGELSIEWQTTGEKPWHQYLNFPSIGISTAFLDFSHPDTLGYAVAIYPYLKLPILRYQHFNMAFKAGAGLSYVTKTFDNATAYHPDGSVYLNKSNAAIGSHVNVYLTANLNLEIPLTKGWSITSNCGWNHTSNGSIVQPNSGINMLDMYLG
ncbi:MAG TPA: acyloxyacyl hydrolase, partial [Paludibacteraceae bacterium]|nr:acyloxyacyl hydrolase [Paludibacteraceae bacterium]